MITLQTNIIEISNFIALIGVEILSIFSLKIERLQRIAGHELLKWRIGVANSFK